MFPATRKAFTASPKAISSPVFACPTKTLILSSYRKLLKESQYFDAHPLAKALLSASPYLRKDSSWVEVVNRPPITTKAVTDYCGIDVNTLALPTPKTMKQFVQERFRSEAAQWDPMRFFAWIRRLDLAKKLHENCSVAIPPRVPAVSPKLQLVTESPPPFSPGTLLMAHPVLVDDFTQAVILLAGKDGDRSVGLTLNADAGEVDFVLQSDRLNALAPTSVRKLLKSDNKKFFSKWTIYHGGSVQSLPVLLHKSAALANAVDALPKTRDFMSCTEENLHGSITNGWYVHSLFHVLCCSPKLVKQLTPNTSRIVMNHVAWDTTLLQQEFHQNWWLATEPKSSCKALPSLLKSRADDSMATMWQRVVSNLGGDLSDFSRLKVSDDEEGEYRKLIRTTFEEDMVPRHQQDPTDSLL